MEDKKRIGFALCGSFCTIDEALGRMEALAGEGWDLYPILSERAANVDTRFGRAQDFRARAEAVCGKSAVTELAQAEALGKTLDALLIAPCTGATLARLAHGLSDTVVSFTAKGCLRGDKPVVLALSTNDALGASAPNIGALLTRRGVYFVPFGQDDPAEKPRSAAARLPLLSAALRAALEGRQLQPILCGPC